MVYRNDVDALAARLTSIETELAERARERAEVANMLAEARAVDQAERSAFEHGERRRRWVVRLVFGAVSLAIGAIGASLMLARPIGFKDREAAMLNRLHGYAYQACQCSDKPCADRVLEDMNRWTKAMSAAEQRQLRTLPGISHLDERMAKCVAQAAGWPRGTDCLGIR
jgi:hypothetical protein